MPIKFTYIFENVFKNDNKMGKLGTYILYPLHCSHSMGLLCKIRIKRGILKIADEKWSIFQSLRFYVKSITITISTTLFFYMNVSILLPNPIILEFVFGLTCLTLILILSDAVLVDKVEVWFDRKSWIRLKYWIRFLRHFQMVLCFLQAWILCGFSFLTSLLLS